MKHLNAIDSAKLIAGFVGILGLASVSFGQDAINALEMDWNNHQHWMGVRYVYGGDSQNGIDCSALTRRAFRELQIELPRTAAQQWSATANARLTRSQLEPNDLVFFWTDDARRGVVTHVGVYKGGGLFIDANSAAGYVKVDNIDDKYWAPRFLGGGRVLRNVGSGTSVLLRPWSGYKPLGSYYMAYNGGGGQVAGNSPNPWDWETWFLSTNGNGPMMNGSWVCLRSQSGLFLSTDGSWRPALANRTGVAGWEWFRVVREKGDGLVRSGDRIALQGWQGPYLGANLNYGDWKVGCWYDFGGFGGWETITIVVK